MRRIYLLMACLVWAGGFGILGYGCYIPLKCLLDTNCHNDEMCDPATKECRFCTPKSKTQCNPKDGHIYWLDACGRTGEQAALCAQGCEANGCRTTKICGSSCAPTCQCPEGLYCIRGTCQICEKDSDCGTGNLCKAGRCTHQDNRCTSDAACAKGETCQGGVCVFTSCVRDTDCGVSKRCDNGRCVASGCRGRTDCPKGQVCLGERCQPCRNDNDCGPGESCQLGSCIPSSTACKNSADCAPQQVCAGGSCVAGNCLEDRDCSAPNDTCVKFICQQAAECGPSKSCLPGKACVNGKCEDTSTCKTEPPRCAGVEIEICEGGVWRRSQCPTGQSCQQGKCSKTACMDNADCISGFVCRTGVCEKASCTEGTYQCAFVDVQLCKGGTWVTFATCKAPQRCEQGKCIDPPPCKADAECMGQICDLTTGKCVKPQCFKDADCSGDDMTCRSGRCCNCSVKGAFVCKAKILPPSGVEYQCVDGCLLKKIKDCGSPPAPPPICDSAKEHCTY